MTRQQVNFNGVMYTREFVEARLAGLGNDVALFTAILDKMNAPELFKAGDRVQTDVPFPVTGVVVAAHVAEAFNAWWGVIKANRVWVLSDKGDAWRCLRADLRLVTP